MSETIFNIKPTAAMPEGTILFTKRPSVRYSLGPARLEGDKAIADLIFECELPDPRYCAMAVNVGKPE